MDASPFPLARCYKGWDLYQQQLVTTVAPLSPDELALQAAPHLRALGPQVAHMIAPRARWLSLDLKKGGAALDPLLGWDGWTENAGFVPPPVRLFRRGTRMLTEKRHRIVRGVVGAASLAIGLIGLVVVAGLPPKSIGWDPAILWSITVFGAFTLGHLAISVQCSKLVTKSTELKLRANPSNLVQLAGALVAAPGIIVGLVAAFVHPLPTAVKVGVVLLALGVLAGFVLYGTLTPEAAQPDSDDIIAGDTPIGPYVVEPRAPKVRTDPGPTAKRGIPTRAGWTGTASTCSGPTSLT